MDPNALPKETVTLSMLEAAIPKGTWFHFNQNNSGGYYTGPARNVLIAAEDMDAARARLEAQEGYSSESCSCCGSRWYGHEMDREDMANRLFELADPEHWENRESGEGIPVLLVLPEYAPNKVAPEAVTIASLMHAAVKLGVELTTATGEAFEDLLV